MSGKRRRSLIQVAAIVVGIVILNVAFPQPWHITLINIVIGVSFGFGFGIGSSVTDDVIKRRRKP